MLPGRLLGELFFGLFSVNPVLTSLLTCILFGVVLLVIVLKMRSPSVDKKDLKDWVGLLVALIVFLFSITYIYFTAWK